MAFFGAFLPLLVEAGEKKVVVPEADLEYYPGMRTHEIVYLFAQTRFAKIK